MRTAGTGHAPKQCGYVIDYVGVTRHLAKALKAYAGEDIEGVLTDLETDQVGNLRAQRARVRAVFSDHGATPGPSAEAKENCVQLLVDGAVRDRFETELSRFLATVDTVLPLPKAREFLPDARARGPSLAARAW